MASSRDERLAAKLRAKQGDSYVSASDRKARVEAPAEPNASHADIYDQVRATPESQQRRAAAKSEASRSGWRKTLADKWNR